MSKEQEKNSSGITYHKPSMEEAQKAKERQISNAESVR